MDKYLEAGMQEQSHLLVLGGSLFMAVGVLVFALLQPLGSVANSAEDACSAVLAADSYHSPECCSQCHPGKYQAWSQTNHAAARVDPLFLVDLEQEPDSGECYRCHTTGYDADSHRYALAGVTCEACHEPYQPGHDRETMAMLSPMELCGSCHTQTLKDWKAGIHGEPDQTCNSCHPPHS